MRIERCANGHFYDTDTYSSCPHCAGANDGMAEPAEGVTMAFWDQNGAKKQESYPATLGLSPELRNPMGAVQMSEPATQGMFQGNAYAGQNVVPDSMGSIYTNQTKPLYAPPVGDSGKTIGFWDLPQGTVPTAGDKTTAPCQSAAASTGPVVGWLVCVEGSHYGKGLPLTFGNNFIGRDTSVDKNMNVCLYGDLSVSRDQHAVIAYEPLKREFYASPGKSHELFYLNGSVVLQTVQLKDRDVLTIGKNKLVFVRFCDENYGWIDQEEKKD